MGKSSSVNTRRKALDNNGKKSYVNLYVIIKKSTFIMEESVEI